MFHDEKLFPENDKFKPERWLRENKMDTQLKSLSNLIWGHGARMCIGRRFAEQEMHIVLTKVTVLKVIMMVKCSYILPS
jgi:cytochrome P450